MQVVGVGDGLGGVYGAVVGWCGLMCVLGVCDGFSDVG